jgi:small subunit ribosomal protein S6
MRKATTQNYEVTFILGEEASAEQTTAKTQEVRALIEQFGGAVEKDEQWGRRELAYPIKKNRSGMYVTLWFSLPTDQLKALDEALRFDEALIRHLVTKAYTTAQPGSLYPVAEEEKPARGSRRPAADTVSAEEELRRHSAGAKKDKAATEEDGEALSEEDRLKQLDVAVDELLKDDKDESDSQE